MFDLANSEVSIDHVSDTALWVAHYRALETERPDAMFSDPLAKVLTGERGKKIAENMGRLGKYTQWSVVSRTVIIDQFIESAITDGVDLILNLGAGLDSRPYRLNLPPQLKWIEVDYPQIIAHKKWVLKNEKPRCDLIRVSLDLADLEKRKSFLADWSSQAKKVLILTEGVIPYLSPEQVSSLAHDLHEQPNFVYWITEYFDPAVYKYLKSNVRTKKMKNAPFLFYPPDWLAFFLERGWVTKDLQYSYEIAKKYGRKVPMPWFAILFRIFASKALLEKSEKMAGYLLFRRR